jgi:hypothetical protein
VITQWNDEEDDALQGLPLRTQIIYLRGLRRHINYQNGIVGGEERRISLKMLGEISEEFINRQQHQPNKKQVIVSLDQLRKAGLIERISDPDYLVFFMPLAASDRSARNNHGTTTAQPRHNHGTDHGTDHGTAEHREINTSSDNHGTDDDTAKKRQKIDAPELRHTSEYPLSVIRNSSSKRVVGGMGEKQENAASPLPDWINHEAWLLFEQHRKKKRKPINELSRPILLAKLNGLSQDQQRQMIEYSISAGYPDLYPECLKRINAASNETAVEKQSRRIREAIYDTNF